MGMAITTEVPLRYQWENIETGLKDELIAKSIAPTRELVSHYAWLLEVTSWSYGIHWNPTKNTISLTIPFEGPLEGYNTFSDENDYNDVIAQDKISQLLANTLEKVPLRRLLAHFKKSN